MAVPDWFAGEPMDMKNFPPKDPEAFPKFVARVEPGCPGIIAAVWWKQGKAIVPLTLRPCVLQAKEHFKAVGLGGKKIGICGFCWGGRWAREGGCGDCQD